MTSGNLLNLKIWEEIGKFDEAKFEKVGKLLIIRLKENNKEDVRAVKI